MRSIACWKVFFTYGESELQEVLVVAPLDMPFSDLIDQAAHFLTLHNNLDAPELDVTYAEVYLAADNNGVLVFPIEQSNYADSD